MTSACAKLFGRTACVTLRCVDELAEIAQEYRAAKAAVDELRPRLYAAIVEAARAKVPQVEIVRVTGLTRERVRQVCRAAGVTSPE